MYRNLRAEMARNNIAIRDVAKILDVRDATVRDKINGRFRFYYEEAALIKNRLFPDCSVEYLFDKDEQSSA